MVDFLFVWVGLGVRLADTLGNDFVVAFLMTGILAVGTLHTGCVFEKVAA